MANRNSHRRRGRPKGQPKTGGRKPGTPNRVTLEARAAASEIVDSPTYRRRLAARANRGTLPGSMESLLWFYSKGRPQDEAVPYAQVIALVRTITALFLEVVEDPNQRRQFAHGLRRKLPGGADVGMPVEHSAPLPVEPQAPPLTPLPLAAAPEDEEMVI